MLEQRIEESGAIMRYKTQTYESRKESKLGLKQERGLKVSFKVLFE